MIKNIRYREAPPAKIHLPSPALGIKGYIDWELIDTDGKTVVQKGKQPQLILNNGLNKFATQSQAKSGSTQFCETMRNYIEIGTGSLETRYDSGAVTASQTGTTVTASASFFSSGDVGNTIHWDTGETGWITSFTSATEVEVNKPQTVVSGEFTKYATNQTGLVAAIAGSRTNSDGGFGAEEYSNFSEDIPNNRLVAESRIVKVWNIGASFNITEFGFSDLSATGANLTIRDLFRNISGVPISIAVQAGQQLKVRHILKLFAGPYQDPGVAKTIVVSNLNDPTYGDNVTGTYSLSLADTTTNTLRDVWQHGILPYENFINFHNSVFPDNTALRVTAKQHLGGSGQNMWRGDVGVWDAYVANSFTRIGRSKLNAATAPGVSVKGFGHGRMSGFAQPERYRGGILFWFDTPTAIVKPGTHELHQHHKHTWEQSFA